MISIRELTCSLSLGLELIAGGKGEARQITWVHTVDLPDPWRWISPGNLVMTTGAGLPERPAQQVEWLEKLTLSHASGLIIARQASAAEISPAMLAAADRLMFPLLQASFEQEFVKLSRAIIERLLQHQQERYSAGEQLFQTYAATLHQNVDLPGRLHLLAESLQLELDIEDALTGSVLFSSRQLPIPLERPSLSAERVPIAGRSRTTLVIYRNNAIALKDPLLVRSLSGLLEIELERLMIERDQQRREGSALLENLLNGETALPLIVPLLERRGLTGSLVCLVLVPGDHGNWNVDDLHHAPGVDAACLLLRRDDRLLVVSQDKPSAITALRNALGEKTVCGISSPVTATLGIGESFRQAHLACTQATELHKSVLRYGEAKSGLTMIPTSLTAARAMVDRYLGPVIEHDRSHDGALLVTLIQFLQNDGNWKTTSYELAIHRQTLVYRLRLITKLTGLSPTSTHGTALLWLALEAGRASKLLPE